MNKSFSEPIGIAIAGLGFGESVHLPALNSNPELQAMALWHPRKERLNNAKGVHNLIGYSDWKELLQDHEIKGVIIATPPHKRYQLALEALEAGKHLLLEKPVALSAQEVKELQKLAIQKNLSVAVNFEYRAVPLFLQAKRLIENGLLGTPWLIKLDWLMSSRANPSRPWNWYSQEEVGGGVNGALGTHAFDILHWLFGPIASVSALKSTSIRNRLDPKTTTSKNVTSEDTTLAQFEINDLSSSSKVPTQVTLSAVAKHGRGFWLEIYGSKGSLLLGSPNQKDYVHGFGLWASSGEEAMRAIPPDEDLSFNTTWSDGRIAPVARLQSWWAESINNGTPMVPGLAEGFASQLVCDKIKEASMSGTKISI